MPNGVALTTRSADPTASARALEPGDTTDSGPARQRGGGRGPFGRPVEDRNAGSPRHQRGRAPRPAPRRPAPITTHRRPAGVKSAPRASDATKPSPSVLVPSSTPSVLHDAVHGVEPLRHLGALVDQCHHVRFVRHGDRKSADVGAAHRLERLRRPTGCHIEGQRMPASLPIRARRTPHCGAEATANARSGCRSPPPVVSRDRRRPARRRWSPQGRAQGRPRLLASCSLASCSA